MSTEQWVLAGLAALLIVGEFISRKGKDRRIDQLAEKVDRIAKHLNLDLK